MRNNKQKLYESIMRKISKVVKQKLNEASFPSAAYDRWVTSTPYDDENEGIGVIELDIRDILYNSQDDVEFADNIINQLGLSDEVSDDDIILLETDGETILNEEEIDDLLEQIYDEDDKERFKDLLWDQINWDLKKENINWDYYLDKQIDYEDDMRDAYRDDELLRSLED